MSRSNKSLENVASAAADLRRGRSASRSSERHFHRSPSSGSDEELLSFHHAFAPSPPHISSSITTTTVPTTVPSTSSQFSSRIPTISGSTLSSSNISSQRSTTPAPSFTVVSSPLTLSSSGSGTIAQLPLSSSNNESNAASRPVEMNPVTGRPVHEEAEEQKNSSDQKFMRLMEKFDKQQQQYDTLLQQNILLQRQVAQLSQHQAQPSTAIESNKSEREEESSSSHAHSPIHRKYSQAYLNNEQKYEDDTLVYSTSFN